MHNGRATWRAQALTRIVLAAAVVSCGGDSGSAPAPPAAVASVSASTGTLLLQVGQAFFLSATAVDTAGHTVTGAAVTWSSNAASVATVDQSGVVTALSAGTAVVTATAGTHSATVAVTVIPAVRRVVVAPAAATLEMGFTLQMSLVLLDQLENQVHAVVPVTWAVTSGKAGISSSGLLSPTDTGAVIVTGTMTTSGATPLTATAAITVLAHTPVASVLIVPNPLGLMLGQTRTLLALAQDANGAALAGRSFAWSGVTSVASVGATTGLVTALQVGTAQLTATSEGVSGSSALTVFATTTGAGLGVGFGAEQFVAVAAGASFAMGATDGNQDEKPVRLVTFNIPFKIQKTELTRAQWASVMALPPGNVGCDQCPVTGITWDQAVAFIAQLNITFPNNGFRLPTEAQWEYAARAGTAGVTPGPLELTAQYFTTSENHVWPVALRQPNAFGLYDVLGNASEWTSDWYAVGYNAAETVDPQGPATGLRHVDRGAAFSSIAALLRSSARNAAPSDQVGVRLVRN